MVMVGRTHEVDHVPVQVTLAPTLLRKENCTPQPYDSSRAPRAFTTSNDVRRHNNICMCVARPHMSALPKPLPCTQGRFAERHISDTFGTL